MNNPETNDQVKAARVLTFDIESAIDNWNKDFAIKRAKKLGEVAKEIIDILQNDITLE